MAMAQKNCIYCKELGRWVCGNPPDCGEALAGEEFVALPDGQVGTIEMHVFMKVIKKGNKIQIDPNIVYGADGGVEPKT